MGQGIYDLSLGDDFEGDDEMQGDDDFGDDPEFSGTPRRRRKRQRPAGNGDLQTQIMPFPRTDVLTLTQATITAFPQRPFQTKRFAWASTTAAYFTVEELKIGQDSMFVQAGSAEAEIFSQTGVGVALKGFIARPGVTISLVCTNRSLATRAVGASIIGEALVA